MNEPDAEAFNQLRESITDGLDEIENQLNVHGDAIESIAANEAETARAHNALTRRVNKWLNAVELRLAVVESKL